MILLLREVTDLTAHFNSSGEVLAEIVDYTPRRSMYRQIAKRAFDLSFLLVACIVVVPAVAILALIVMTDGGNPFYVQRRVGKNGKTFSMLKLRSMVIDADRKLLAHLRADPCARAQWDETQKLQDDPRITRFGRLMRKTSLDELPQFWNVLMGDMSVVGPRPMMPSQRDLYPGQAYYAMKPGVTGFWQVGDRNNTTFAARARFDAAYYDQVSLGTDLMVILKTIRCVLRGTGV